MGLSFAAWRSWPLQMKIQTEVIQGNQLAADQALRHLKNRTPSSRTPASVQARSPFEED